MTGLSRYWVIILVLFLTGCYETTRQIVPSVDRDNQRSYKHGDEHYSIVSQGVNRVTMVSLQRVAGSRIEFTVEVENKGKEPIYFGFDDVSAKTADQIYLYIHTLGDLNKEIAKKESYRQFINTLGTAVAVAGAQGATYQRGTVRANTTYIGPGGIARVVGSGTYRGVTYDPARAAIQRSIYQNQGNQQSNNIKNQADNARNEYSSKILKGKELNPGEKADGSLWVEAPYDITGPISFIVYAGSERHVLVFNVGQ